MLKCNECHVRGTDTVIDTVTFGHNDAPHKRLLVAASPTSNSNLSPICGRTANTTYPECDSSHVQVSDLMMGDGHRVDGADRPT
jgi:hypothetical protein